MAEVIVGIPARMSASRFPGKPLADILGLPMIQHVYRRCTMAQGVDRVIVATCDDIIADVCRSFGAEVVMTSRDIERPGLRVAAACEYLGVNDHDLVVVVQGDEPLVHPSMIEQAATALASSHCRVGTLVGSANEVEWQDPNEVKVVLAEDSTVMYMSRSPIPSNERSQPHYAFKQVAIMPFEMAMLKAFQEMNSTPLERLESIELLRAIEHRIDVLGILTHHSNVSVDTPEGLAEATEAMARDTIFTEYAP